MLRMGFRSAFSERRFPKPHQLRFPITRAQILHVLLVPMAWEQPIVLRRGESLTDQRGDAAVSLGADESAHGLDDAGHARIEIRVLKAAIVVMFVVVLPHQLALEAYRRQRRADHDDANELFAGKINTLAEHARSEEHTSELQSHSFIS